MNKGRVISIALTVLAAGLVVIFMRQGGLRKSMPEDAGKQAVDAQSAAVTADNKTMAQPPDQAPTVTQEQGDGAEAPTVEVPLDKRQLMGVRTVAVSVRPLYKTVRSVGRIEYDERRLATVNTKLEGWIEELSVDYTGRLVKKGETLAGIYSPDLFATQQEYLNVLKWSSSKTGGELERMLARDAEAIVEAARQRLKLKDLTDEQIQRIEQTGKPIRTFSVYSPVSGYVVQKNAVKGMRVMPGEKLFDVADLSSVWVVSDIFEYDLPFVRVGQTAKIGLSYLQGKVFNAQIDYVYPSLSGETRTAKVRFSMPNPAMQLKPQMFTDVEIKIDLGKRLAVPDDAVIDTGKRQVVYVDKGDGNFEPREVQTGAKAEGWTEILGGLKSGDKVAQAGTFLIDSEAKLKGIVK